MGSITLSPFLYAFYLPKNAIHSASATAPYGAVAEKDKKLFGLGNTVGFHILCVDILDLLQAGGHGGNDGKHQNDHVEHSADNEEVVVAPCKLDHNGSQHGTGRGDHGRPADGNIGLVLAKERQHNIGPEIGIDLANVKEDCHSKGCGVAKSGIDRIQGIDNDTENSKAQNRFAETDLIAEEAEYPDKDGIAQSEYAAEGANLLQAQAHLSPDTAAVGVEAGLCDSNECGQNENDPEYGQLEQFLNGHSSLIDSSFCTVFVIFGSKKMNVNGAHAVSLGGTADKQEGGHNVQTAENQTAGDCNRLKACNIDHFGSKRRNKDGDDACESTGQADDGSATHTDPFGAEKSKGQRAAEAVAHTDEDIQQDRLHGCFHKGQTTKAEDVRECAKQSDNFRIELIVELALECSGNDSAQRKGEPDHSDIRVGAAQLRHQRNTEKAGQVCHQIAEADVDNASGAA